MEFQNRKTVIRHTDDESISNLNDSIGSQPIDLSVNRLIDVSIISINRPDLDIRRTSDFNDENSSISSNLLTRDTAEVTKNPVSSVINITINVDPNDYFPNDPDSDELNVDRKQRKQPHQCKICHTRYRFKKYLKYHERRVHRVNEMISIHTCSVCTKVFPKKAILLAHFIEHQDKNGNFYCPECNFQFHTLSDLTLHITIIHPYLGPDTKDQSNWWFGK